LWNIPQNSQPRNLEKFHCYKRQEKMRDCSRLKDPRDIAYKCNMCSLIEFWLEKENFKNSVTKYMIGTMGHLTDLPIR
jgi:hypothetical protein